MMNLAGPRHLENGLGHLCVGRESELARLRSYYERASREGGHCVLVSGPSGVGKSRLLQELKRRARLDGVCVLEGRCRPDKRAYQPFLEVVREASCYLADLAPQLFAALRSVEILESLEGREYDRDVSRFDRWEDRRTALFESVGELLRTVAHVRPPLVMLHDLQLADENTLSLLGHLLETLSGPQAFQANNEDHAFRGLFVLSERQTPEEPLQTMRFLTAVSHAILPLEDLDRAGVEAFLSAPSVISRFIEVTGGNPRQIEAFIDHSSANADDLLRERIAGIPEPARAMVQALAVLGRPTGPRTLALLAGIQTSDLAKNMDLLLGGEILVSSISDGALKLAFKSTSDQDAVLAGLPKEARSRLHQQVGEEMLRQGDVVCAAEHLLHGHDGSMAAQAALSAGERLEAAFAYERAIDMYERAREKAIASVRQELDDRLCDLLELTGEYDRAVDITARLAKEHPSDPQLQRRLGHLYLQQGDFTAAGKQLKVALSMLDSDTQGASDRGLVVCDLAEVAYLQGEHESARTYVAEVVGLVHTETPVPSIKARNTLGKVSLERGEFTAAAELFEANIKASREATIIREEIRALINLGITHLRQGRYEEAANCYRQGLSAAEASCDYRHRAFCLQNLGVLAHWRRDYASALQLFHDAIQTFLKLGHKSWLSWLALDLGDLYLELGDSIRAESMLELSSGLVEISDDSQTPLFAQTLKGKLAAYQGRVDEAEQDFRGVRERALRAHKIDEAATASLEIARLLLQTQRPGDAMKVAQELTDAPTVKTRATALALLAEACIQSGADLQDTRQSLEAARALYERAGDSQGLWSVLARQAELLRSESRHGDAEAAIREAVRIEARIRKTVPEELLESYLLHPQRRALLAAIGATSSAPRPASSDVHEPSTPVPSVAVSKSPLKSLVPRRARYDTRYPKILGEHEDLLRVLDLVDKIAPIDSTVLVRGESGTGKELVAEALHEHSRRSERPFVKVNCGALVESLLLSELFGHERGAFTGATRRKLGRFEVADGGTIFLDEIGDITPKTQVALLRVLQEKQFERVGGNASIRVNVRIVCATNRDLEKMVEEGTFREDLYYRLKTFQIDLPALRQRGADVLLLARRFLEDLVSAGECPPRLLNREAERALLGWRWPGNVRELQNVLRSVSLLTEGEFIEYADLRPFLPESENATAPGALLSIRAPHQEKHAPSPLAGPHVPSSPGQPEEPADPYQELVSEGISLHEYKKKIEEACIARALRETNGNITRAAALLKMKRPRLSQLVKEYGLTGQAGKE